MVTAHTHKLRLINRFKNTFNKGKRVILDAVRFLCWEALTFATVFTVGCDVSTPCNYTVTLASWLTDGSEIIFPQINVYFSISEKLSKKKITFVQKFTFL